MADRWIHSVYLRVTAPDSSAALVSAERVIEAAINQVAEQLGIRVTDVRVSTVVIPYLAKE